MYICISICLTCIQQILVPHGRQTNHMKKVEKAHTLMAALTVGFATWAVMHALVLRSSDDCRVFP